MKNARKNNEIMREDFDSLFLWKVFWKLIISETPLVFGLKILFLGIGFLAMLFILFLLGEFAV
jgi:hypothetical protein